MGKNTLEARRGSEGILENASRIYQRTGEVSSQVMKMLKKGSYELMDRFVENHGKQRLVYCGANAEDYSKREGVCHVDVDLHSHGPWVSDDQGFLNLQRTPRYIGEIVKIARAKGLAVCGITDFQSRQRSEKRYENLLKGTDKSGVAYNFRFYEDSALAVFEFKDRERVFVPRVQEIETVEKMHFLAVNLPFKVDIPGGMSIKETLSAIKSQGGEIVANHPYGGLRGRRLVEMNRYQIDLIEFNGAAEAGLFGSSLKPLWWVNSLAKKRTPVLDLEILGSSDAKRRIDMGGTFTRVYLDGDCFGREEEGNFVRNIIVSVKQGKQEVYSRRPGLGSLAVRSALIRYDKFRREAGWIEPEYMEEMIERKEDSIVIERNKRKQAIKGLAKVGAGALIGIGSSLLENRVLKTTGLVVGAVPLLVGGKDVIKSLIASKKNKPSSE